MIRRVFGWFSPQFPQSVVYMLQSTEYRARPYLSWLWRSKDLSSVAHRKSLDKTKVAFVLLVAVRTGLTMLWLVALVFIMQGLITDNLTFILQGSILALFTPVIVAHGVLAAVALGRWLVIRPKTLRLQQQADTIFKNHRAHKIAIAGSYGKTTMKELLKTVLSTKFSVAATPANKNVAIAHAWFANSLRGDEEVLIIEYGEGKPGDIAAFAETTHPDAAIITGVAPAHLDTYKTIEAIAKDMSSLGDYVAPDRIYVNQESEYVQQYLNGAGMNHYSRNGVLGWRVSEVKISVKGTSFRLKKGKNTMKLQTPLLGRHLVGPVALAAIIAYQQGMTIKQVESAIVKTKPFDHRLQPYELHGATVIDDTYNGNIEGVKAGLQLLSELKAKRKIYVTPGLVEQGSLTKEIHQRMGEAIAEADPNIVYLMENSTTRDIQDGLRRRGFKGRVELIDDPLGFYTHLDNFIASGDLVLMQNDWTDNYA